MDVAALILNPSIEADFIILNQLLLHPNTQQFDTIHLQLADLVHVRNPSQTFVEPILNELIAQILNGIQPFYYGVWVYYPWSHRLVHTLPESEFLEVRTNRNLHKITVQEQKLLKTKKVGIIGLSVGQSVALTMAIERACGELVIADFDTLELSNLNRIRSGIHNIGISKVAMVAREIAEIDPFLKVTCYPAGITSDNLVAFLSLPTPLDVLIDECDTLHIKIEARKYARQLGIPVLMDTSDRGLLDIERFDIEPSRPLFHGYMGALEAKNFEEITPDQRLSIIAQIVGARTVSSRLKASVLEMGFSNRAWPQLASAVALGGSIVTDSTRRILLEEPVTSGRYYIDLSEKIVKKEAPQKEETIVTKPVLAGKWDKPIADYFAMHKSPPTIPIFPKEIITTLVKSGCAAPSSGNNQPWNWVYKGGILFLFHDTSRTNAFGDFLQIPTYISMGAAIENIYLAADNMGLEAMVSEFPIDNQSPLFAAIILHKKNNHDSPLGNILAAQILQRNTDRRHYNNEKIEKHHLAHLKILAEESTVKANIQILETTPELEALGSIVAEMDRIRLLHPIAHKDFFNTELRWTIAQAQASGDGIDLPSLHLSAGDTVGVQLLSDPDTATILNAIDGGDKLLENAKNMFKATAAVVFITVPQHLPQQYLQGGRCMEKIWLYCTAYNIAVQPIVSPLYFFYRHLFGNNNNLSPKEIAKITLLRNKFSQLFNTQNHNGEIVMLRLGRAEKITHLPIRRPIEEVLWIEQ